MTPKKFVIRERFKFWSDMQRKPGETIHELAARIRQDAATCDFTSIRNPQDEAYASVSFVLLTMKQYLRLSLK